MTSSATARLDRALELALRAEAMDRLADDILSGPAGIGSYFRAMQARDAAIEYRDQAAALRA